MTLISIGPDAIDRTGGGSITWTMVMKDAPADGTGTIRTIYLWFNTPGSAVEVATFIYEGSLRLSTRDYVFIGDVASGSLQTFGLDPGIAVETGDYIGIYGAGEIERDTSGGRAIWYRSGDYIPCTSDLFSVVAGYVASIHGTSEAPPAAKGRSFGEIIG